MQSARDNYISWDECLMRMAHVIADRSKDPSFQAGAVVVDPNNVIMGLGYNGFPRNTDEGNFPWEREGDFKETKYAYVCHAEINAIFNAHGRQVKDCRIYCTLFPCNECAKAIIQTGVKEVVYECDKYHDLDMCVVARRLFDAAGIKYRQYISAFAKDPSVLKKV